MRSPYDAAFLIAFGGPTSPEEIRPFLARVLRGQPTLPERTEEIVRHYKAVGGRSPLNEITLRQASALEKALRHRGFSLPVYVGMRNSRPFIRETLDQMTADGVRQGLALILSPLQTEVSWQRYQRDIKEAQEELGGAAPRIDFCPGWHDHPLFVQALADQIHNVLDRIAAENRHVTPLVFTAHSLPVAMAHRSPYVEQLEETARLVAERLGHQRWSIAYQSRSGRPSDLWLEPDLGQVIRDLAGPAVREIVVAPIGFVCDHVEVLYDLDIEAKKIAEDLGIRFNRASCPDDHPTFVAMMANVIEEKIKAGADRG